MIIGNVELMSEFFYKHVSMEKVIMKYDIETEEEFKKKRVNL